MAGFVDLVCIEGPDDGMRFTLEVGTYRVIGRQGDPSDSTVQMTRDGDRMLDADQQRVVDSVASRGIRTRFKKRGADILVDDGSVSRTHAVVFADDSGTSVADLMSTNGTKVNGAPIEDVDLSDGDVIQIGQTKLRLTLDAT
jgi:hypothetical protein